MERELAGIMMEDQSIFYVDFIKQELRDAQHPENTIALSRMDYNGQQYSCMFDPVSRNIADHRLPASPDDPPYLLKVRNLTQMHPEPMARLYGVPLEEVMGKTDKEFFDGLGALREKQHMLALLINDPVLLQQRLAGLRPELKVGQEKYCYKYEDNTLYALADPQRSIELNKLRLASSGEYYACMYDLAKGVVVKEGPPGGYGPEVASMLIPREDRIDPVGVARQRGFADHDLLYRNPIQKDLEAKIYPLTPKAVIILLRRQKPQKRRGKGL
jgi:hypothetical protein